MPRRAVLAILSVVIAAFALGAPPAGGLGRVAAGPAVADPIIAAVGDIACKNPPGNNRRVCQYDDVAALVAGGNYARFLTLGDVQYEAGAYQDFLDNYDVYFGSLLPITEPAPGNHEYGTPDGAGYYAYFGVAGHGPGGYYSYDIGAWHVIALNSAICPAVVGCAPGDPQYEWLKADLADHPAACTLAYWHHPRFDWLTYQNANWTQDYEFLRTAPFWDLLYANGADVVLNGHNHNYSRWLPMDASGAYDRAQGIRQFIVGTGGRNLNGFGGPNTKPTTFVRGQSREFGILELTLHRASYDFRFRSTLGGASGFNDAGANVPCH